ncbi:type VII secretion protein EsaA [Furfurilactobacillus sp. WILCCON 0119]
MKAFLTKYWHLGVGLILALGLIGFFVHASINNSSVSESSKQKSYKLTVALVNEDQGGRFHNMDYNFGNNFVNMITKDPTNNWTVTSRDIAESGLRHKTYEMVLIIPNNFTQRTLQLENRNPQQAQLQYEVNTSKNPNIRTQAQQKVTALLQLFNRRVINMYFSSVVNNLHTAQTNVGSMVNREGYLNGNLQNSVNKPFQGLNDNFSEITDQSKDIQDSYNDWQDQAKSFNDEAKSAMDDTVSNGKDSLKGLSDFNNSQNSQMTDNKKVVTDYYTKSIDTEKELLDTDHQKLLANDKQSTDAYDKQYQAYTDELKLVKSDEVNKLSALNSELLDGGPDQPTTALQSLLNANNQLIPAIDTLKDRYDAQTKVLSDENDQLAMDQGNMREFFTGDKTTALTEDNMDAVQTHLQEMIKSSLEQDYDLEKTQVNDKGRQAMTDYMNRSVGAVDSNITAAVDWMQFAGGLPQNQAAKYQHDAQLVEKYAKEHNVTQTNTSAVDSIKSILGTSVGTNIQQSIQFTIPELKKGEFAYIELSDVKGAKLDRSALVTLLNNASNGNFHAALSDSPVDKKSGIQITALKDLLDKKDTDGGVIENDARIIDISAADLNKNNVITLDQDNFPQSLLANSGLSYTCTMNVTHKDPDTEKTSLQVVDTSYLGFTYINNTNSTAVTRIMGQSNKMLYQVAQAASVIEAYYGANAADDGLQTDTYSATLEEQAPDGSVYKQMNNKSMIDEIAALVSSHLVEQYRQPVEQLDQQMTTEQETLQAQMKDTGYVDAQTSALATLKQANDAITQKGKDLMAWYQEALDYTNAVNEPAKTPLVLDETLVDFKPAEQPELADDQTTGPELIKSYQQQLSDSQNTITQTMADSAKIKSMTPAFEHLKSSTNQLSSTSKGIVNNASGLAQTWSNTIAKNGDFSKGFNTVLANTKQGNGDNQNVYNYMANPVSAKNTSEIANSTSILPYYLVLINIFVTLFTAYTLSVLEKRRGVRLVDRFVNVDNLVWKNLPWTLVVGAVGVVEGLLIGYLSRQLLQTNQIAPTAWVLTVMMIQVALLSATTYLLRQVKTMGMAIAMALAALYLFFTPSLGIKVANGTLTKQFMTISPFQYVEHVYTKLTTGIGLGTQGYVILTVIALVVTALNLVVYHPQKEAPAHAATTTK